MLYIYSVNILQNTQHTLLRLHQSPKKKKKNNTLFRVTTQIHFVPNQHISTKKKWDPFIAEALALEPGVKARCRKKKKRKETHYLYLSYMDTPTAVKPRWVQPAWVEPSCVKGPIVQRTAVNPNWIANCGSIYFLLLFTAVTWGTLLYTYYSAWLMTTAITFSM